MTSSKIQDGASSSGRLRVIFGWSSGHARVMFVIISKGNRNLYMWMKGSAHTCGREFLSPSHCACSAYYACALRENVWRRFLMTDLMLEDEDCPSTYHQPTINLSSHHQPTINPPSTYHQPDINLPSTWHQPHINPILQGSHLRVKKKQTISHIILLHCKSQVYIQGLQRFKISLAMGTQQIKVSDGISVNDSLLCFSLLGSNTLFEIFDLFLSNL